MLILTNVLDDVEENADDGLSYKSKNFQGFYVQLFRLIWFLKFNSTHLAKNKTKQYNACKYL